MKKASAHRNHRWAWVVAGAYGVSVLALGTPALDPDDPQAQWLDAALREFYGRGDPDSATAADAGKGEGKREDDREAEEDEEAEEDLRDPLNKVRRAAPVVRTRAEVAQVLLRKRSAPPAIAVERALQRAAPYDPALGPDAVSGACAASCAAFEACVVAGAAGLIQVGTPFSPTSCVTPCDPSETDPTLVSPCETPTQVANRRAAVIDKMNDVPLVIGHRGAYEFALENTYESLRSSLELGADGNENDISWSIDGMPYLIHYGNNLSGTDYLDMTWAELSGWELDDGGLYGLHARLPTVFEIFRLHRQLNAVVALDVQTAPALTHGESMGLLQGIRDALQMQEQDISTWTNNDGVWFNAFYEMSLSLNQMHSDPLVLDEVANNGSILFIETQDPRPILRTLGRPVGQPSCVARHPKRVIPPWTGDEPALLAQALACQPFATTIATTIAEGESIRACSYAVRQLGRHPSPSTSTLAALHQIAWNRSTHSLWNYRGLDGTAAIEGLMRHSTPGAFDLSRDILDRMDPVLTPLVMNVYPSEGHVDWGPKFRVFEAIVHHADRGAARQFLMDYILRSDAGQAVTYPAAVWLAMLALPRVGAGEAEVTALFTENAPQPSRRAQQSRAVLMAIDNAAAGEPWALPLLQQHAPYAIPWISAHTCRAVEDGWAVAGPPDVTPATETE